MPDLTTFLVNVLTSGLGWILAVLFFRLIDRKKHVKAAPKKDEAKACRNVGDKSEKSCTGVHSGMGQDRGDGQSRDQANQEPKKLRLDDPRG